LEIAGQKQSFTVNDKSGFDRLDLAMSSPVSSSGFLVCCRHPDCVGLTFR
jgi:hypothetical protein